MFSSILGNCIFSNFVWNSASLMRPLGATLTSWWTGRWAYILRNPERLGKHSNWRTLICLMSALVSLLQRVIILDSFSGFQNLPHVLVFNPLITGRRWKHMESICSQRRGAPLSCHSAWLEPTVTVNLHGPVLPSPIFPSSIISTPTSLPLLPALRPSSQPWFQAGGPFPPLHCSPTVGADPGLLGPESCSLF